MAVTNDTMPKIKPWDILGGTPEYDTPQPQVDPTSLFARLANYDIYDPKPTESPLTEAKKAIPAVGSILFVIDGRSIAKSGLGLAKDTGSALSELVTWVTGTEKTTKPAEKPQNLENQQAQTAAEFIQIQTEKTEVAQKRVREETAVKEQARIVEGPVDEAEVNRTLRLSENYVRAEGLKLHELVTYREELKHRAQESDKQVSSEELAATQQEVVNINGALEGGTGGAKANISSTGGGAG